MGLRGIGLALAGMVLAIPAKAQPSPPAEAASIPVLLLVDTGSGRELIARQPDRRFAPASMTKVMTAQVAFREMQFGRLRRDAMVTVPDAVAREWNGKGTSLYLRGGDRLSLDTLISAITTVSANDASVVLAQTHAGSIAGWTALMNAEAQRLGMSGSRFATPNGWPDQGATQVTARDLVRLSTALLGEFPAEYRRYFGKTSLTYNGVTQRNRDPVTGTVAGADGIKTGHTREAGYNFLGSARRGPVRLVMVVGGARSEGERAQASRALLEWGFAAWERRPLFPAGAPVAQARVQGGDARQVPLVSPVPLHATFARGSARQVSLTLRYRGPLRAPLAKGSRVAELEIRTADGGRSRVPLFTGRAIGKAGPLDRIINGLYGLIG